MKDMLRLKTSINQEIETALNEQIKMEASASGSYLAKAAWCDANGFDQSAEYFHKQSEEEREHMLRIFNFINDMGGHAISPEINRVTVEYENFRSVFEDALEQEIAVTQSQSRIAAQCLRIGDFITFEFLQWFFKEQREEEYKARRALELFEVIGEEGIGRYTIDKAVLKIEYKG